MHFCNTFTINHAPVFILIVFAYYCYYIIIALRYIIFLQQLCISLTNVYSFRSTDGHVAIVMAVCYFSKWIEARPLKSKGASEVARFLYEDIICRHGCVAIQINDQGREFVNSVSTELHAFTGTMQRITSAYHPQVRKKEFR